MKFSSSTFAKMVTTFLIVTAAFGCAKQEEETTDSASPGSSAPKATLSSWSIATNDAWQVRLDAGGANLSGTQFTFVAKFPGDNSEMHCDGVMNGTESSGTWTSVNCAGPGSGSVADGVNPLIFTTTGTGSYTNDGIYLRLCRNGSGSCLDYH